MRAFVNCTLADMVGEGGDGEAEGSVPAMLAPRRRQVAIATVVWGCPLGVVRGVLVR